MYELIKKKNRLRRSLADLERTRYTSRQLETSNPRDLFVHNAAIKHEVDFYKRELSSTLRQLNTLSRN